MSLKLAPTLWRGVKDFNSAWQISNGTLRMTVMKIGGHIAAISDDADGALNPLWQPKWAPQDASKIPYDGTGSLKRGWIMSKKFGGDAEASLLAGIVGHNLCIDRFGGPHKRMVQQGKLLKEKDEWKPVHGEAGCLPWSLAASDDTSVSFAVALPEAKLDVRRTFAMAGDTINMTTKVVPSDGVEKGIEWCEHVTIGDPFLDGATIEAPVDGAWAFPLEDSGSNSRFTGAKPLDAVDPEVALTVPNASDDPCGDVIATRLTDGWFKVSNQGKTLTYTWDKTRFPWLCLWTEHQDRKELPWEGQERTRGMEFSSKPFPEGPPPEERTVEYQGVPTTCVIPVEGLETTVTIQWK